MKTLADEMLAIVPPSGIGIPALISALAATRAEVRQAMTALEDSGRARIVRYGRRLMLEPVKSAGLACVVCRAPVTRGRKSKRITCSRSCAVSLSWKSGDAAEQRRASIRAERQSPEGRARTRKINEKRWSDPKQRERLSEQNRKRWADPLTKAKLSVAISRAHSTPEQRRKYSENISKRWNDPKGRAKLIAGIRASKGSEEWKRKFRKILKRRWADKRQREVLLAAARRNGKKGGSKKQGEGAHV